MAKRITEKSEIARLNEIYKDLPPNEFEVAQGLIVQAARLRVRLDALWRDIHKNGEVEMFSQSEKQNHMSASAHRQGFLQLQIKTIRRSLSSLTR